MHLRKLQSTIAQAIEGKATFVIKNARVVNVFTLEIIHGDIALAGERILGVGGSYTADQEYDAAGAFVCPGFIDSHVHIESSMSTPVSFARTVLPHGTTTVIADPHEIANVAGGAGLTYMLEQFENLPLSIYMMLPSCVPCLPFEHNGAVLSAKELAPFLSHPRVLGLGEVMDYPSVAAGDMGMLEKLALFANRPIDGHAPLVTGRALAAYRIAGPSSDHECSNYDEMLEKLRTGMHIQLRMGSAAHGIETILRRIAYEELATDNMSFCTDDKHLEDIRRDGHINYILRRAVACGINPLTAVRMATWNAARHYGLNDIGAIAPGYRADLVLLPDLESFRPLAVLTNGVLYKDAPLPIPAPPNEVLNSVHLKPRAVDALTLQVTGDMPVIELIPGQLVTKLSIREVPHQDGLFQSGWGLNKLAVLERHHATGSIGLGILSGLGVVNGALASTVAHDSHNLIVAGDNDADMHVAIDALEKSGGGYAVVRGGKVRALLPLPIAGLMTEAPLEELLDAQRRLLHEAALLGVQSASDPFITLSFLALPVIPEGRLTDMGVFQVSAQRFLNAGNGLHE